MNSRMLLMPILTFVGVVIICYFFSKDAIPNQEGYYEISWNLTYLDFKKYIVAPQVTPLNYLLPYTVVKLTPLSLHNAWKLLDMVFGGLTGAFLIYLYQKKNPTYSIYQKLRGPLLLLSSLGLVYPLTSQTGEGLPVLTSIVGMYFWMNYAFVIGSIFFLISLLSKYTIYLILPAVILWTLIIWSQISAIKKKQLVFATALFFFVAFTYLWIKGGNDVIGQASYSSSRFLNQLTYIPDFIIGLGLGAPIIFATGVLYGKKINLFWLGAVSALLLLFTRYYFWHYPYQVLIFLAAYVLQSREIIERISLKLILLQILLTICLYQLLPIKGYQVNVYPKHQTFTDLKKIEEIIRSDYKGGKVGYYLNRTFDESLPSYEISFMDPKWRFQMEQTEYAVVPYDSLPQQLHYFPDCKLTWVNTYGLNALYKVYCNQDAKIEQQY